MAELRRAQRRRGSVLLHCRGGLGRAGTIAARLRVELGTEPEAAILVVKIRRMVPTGDTALLGEYPLLGSRAEALFVSAV